MAKSQNSLAIEAVSKEGETMNIDTDFKLLQCGSCGVIHYIPKTMYDTCYREGGFWHCPNGHSRGWANGAEKTEIANLRRERDRLQQRIAEKDDDLLHKDREIAAQKGVMTKLKKRASAGTCPCCQRTFQNMAVHMKKQHPDFASKPDLKVVA